MAVSTPQQQQPPLGEYQYAPLSEAGTLRILTLQAGSGDAPLVGSLSIERLDASPPYEAISYVWGAEGQSSSMVCDGQALPLTRSIRGALRRMRLVDGERRLWADQVCINQRDIAERSAQVGLMNGIYKGARHILVWLGPDEEGVAGRAVDMVVYLDRVFGDEGEHKRFRRAHSEELLKQDQGLWVPLSSLTKLPWFNRIWIVQEIGTSAPATLHWGDASMDWEVLSRVSGVLNQHYHYLRTRFAILTPNIRYLYRRFVEPCPDSDPTDGRDARRNRGSFVYELHRARHLLAKDPRDHVYAFLGHFALQRGGEEGLKGIRADYGRDVEDVFVDVAVRALQGAESLLLLSARHDEALASKRKIVGTTAAAAAAASQKRLPSWVPDWRITPLHLLTSPDTPHRASGDTTPSLRVDRERLRVRGVRVDVVAAMSWTFYGKAFQFEKARAGRLPMEVLWRDICGLSGGFDLEARYATNKTNKDEKEEEEQEGEGEGEGESAFFALVQTLTNACVGADRSRPYADIPASEWLADGAAYVVKALEGEGEPEDVVSGGVREAARGGDAFRWSHEATLVSRHRRFGVTREGMYLVGPDAMMVGDVVVVLFGGRTPFVLRRGKKRKRGEDEEGEEEEEEWRLVGECYVHGVMNGEALAREGVEEEEFCIV